MSEIRVVFDCNIFLQSLLNPKSVAAQCIESIRDRRISLFVSSDTVYEFRDVIFRPVILSKLPDLTTNQIEDFIDDILGLAILAESVPASFQLARDTKDEKYINLAIEVKADYIVSRDNDLLDLMTSYTDEAKEFRQKYRNIKVVGPVEFIQVIKEIDLALKP